MMMYSYTLVIFNAILILFLFFLNISECILSVKDTVTKKHQDDEIEAVHHASAVNPTPGLDPVIHDLVPVLSRKDLKGTNKIFDFT